MRKDLLFALVLTALSTVLPGHAASIFADQIVSYDPGVGAAGQFLAPEAALGPVSQENPFSDATDPFDPPYGPNQIVSIGEGGWLEVAFQTPILNHPHNLYGLDFTIFGNSGFVITNDFDPSTFDWIDTPATDASLFGQNLGSTRVLVSRDGAIYYELDPSLAPTVDGFAPTDGSGDPGLPVDPTLTAPDFAGATLEDIRTLYRGSAGGSSFDISWARDPAGRPAFLPEIKFVRVEVLSGKTEIDAFAKVSRLASPGTQR